MPKYILWSKNPELWQLRGKKLSLRSAVEQSRSARLRIQQEGIDREFVRLRTRWRQLVADGRVARARKDQAAMQHIALQIAAFYRDCGALGASMDSLLSEAQALS
jgi:hypothetical protein